MRVINSEKGITLVALIITIIVMLILVGVTINLALNGGLFDRARSGARQTEEKVIHEEIIGCLALDDNGKINVYATFSDVTDLLESQNKSVEVLNPTDEEDVNAEMEEITFKVADKYTYKITDENVMILNE